MGWQRYGRTFDIPAAVRALLAGEEVDARQLADGLLAQAIALDGGRPGDDISVLVLRVLPRTGDEVRRLLVRVPL
jgi:serine phosphatase RsbU (regulator of sigma subunit)